MAISLFNRLHSGEYQSSFYNLMASKKKKKSVNSGDNVWSRLSNNQKHIVCILFLLAAPLFLYHATVLGGYQYMGNDDIQWRAGAESLKEYEEQFNEVAHWASNMFSGMPATTISHPPQVVNLDTLVKALDFIYPAVETWILLTGAYVMLILLGMSPFSALFGSIIMGFTTYIPIIIGAGHNAKFLAYLYIPWIYTGYLLMRNKSDVNRAGIFIFTLALTLHLRAYHPQVTYFFLLPLLSLFIFDLIRAIKTGKGKQFAINTAVLSAGAIIAGLIVAQMYWSTLEYSSFSMRGGSELSGTEGLARDYAFAWSQGWGELLTLLIPGAFGGSELYWGPKSFTSGPHYAGALGFLFFVIGAVKSSHSLKWVFIGPGIAATLFSLGEHFGLLNNFMFEYIPLFNKFRVPEMWLMIAVFCFAVAAAMGFEWMIQQVKRAEKKGESLKPVYYALGIAAIAGLFVFQFMDYEKPGERQLIAQQIASQNNVSPDDPRVSQTVTRVLESQLKPERRELAQSDTLRFFLLVGLGAAIIAAMLFRKIPVYMGASLLIIILLYDLTRVDQRYLSENSLVDQRFEREDILERRERDLDEFIQQNISDREGWPYRVLPILDNAFNNAVPSYFYPSAGGYSGAKLSYYQDVIDEAFFSGTSGLNNGVLSMLNIRYLTLQQPIPLPGYETVFESDNGTVIENQRVMAKAFFADSVAVHLNQADVLESIKAGFNPVETAFVAEDIAISSNPDSTASVVITEYNANQIKADITRSEPGFLVLGEIWYPPGWRATLNGEEIPIIRTNYILRGFEIPAGNHVLEMKLEPVWYTAGRWMSLVGTLMLVGLGVFAIAGYVRKE
ncbi:MAG TPA: hypothetical protein VKM37_07080 [Balneolaceae bacterium]|nr:hypothetical protein [Balneolaceae bacterium]